MLRQQPLTNFQKGHSRISHQRRQKWNPQRQGLKSEPVGMDTQLFPLSLERPQDPWGQLLSETPGEERAGLHKEAEPKRALVLGGEQGVAGPSGSLYETCPLE